MTREELRKEATMTVEWECTPIIDRPLFVHAYITGAEPREKRITELEKENVELRYLANEKYVEQFTKAKELIDELSSSLSVVGECGEEECELLNRAEQFLKESE